jgi:hypothetical protein
MLLITNILVTNCFNLYRLAKAEKKKTPLKRTDLTAMFGINKSSEITGTSPNITDKDNSDVSIVDSSIDETPNKKSLLNDQAVVVLDKDLTDKQQCNENKECGSVKQKEVHKCEISEPKETDPKLCKESKVKESTDELKDQSTPKKPIVENPEVSDCSKKVLNVIDGVLVVQDDSTSKSDSPQLMKKPWTPKQKPAVKVNSDSTPKAKKKIQYSCFDDSLDSQVS